MEKTIAIVNQKGGVGKTTTTFSLGSGLAEKGKRVLIVDVDPQGNLTQMSGYTPDELDRTISDLMISEIDEHRETLNIRDYISSVSENLDLLPSNIELAAVEAIRLPGAYSREYILDRILSRVKEEYKYDFILIDCQPSLGVLTVNALTTADGVIIPCQTHYFSAKGIEQLINSIIRTKKVLNKELKVCGILFCMTTKTRLATEVEALVDEAYGKVIPIFKTKIPQSIKAAEAAASGGKSIFQYSRKSKVAIAYSNFVDEILEEYL